MYLQSLTYVEQTKKVIKHLTKYLDIRLLDNFLQASNKFQYLFSVSIVIGVINDISHFPINRI